MSQQFTTARTQSHTHTKQQFREAEGGSSMAVCEQEELQRPLLLVMSNKHNEDNDSRVAFNDRNEYLGSLERPTETNCSCRFLV